MTISHAVDYRATAGTDVINKITDLPSGIEKDGLLARPR